MRNSPKIEIISLHRFKDNDKKIPSIQGHTIKGKDQLQFKTFRCKTTTAKKHACDWKYF